MRIKCLFDLIMFTSRFVKEIITDIKENPDEWRDNGGSGLKKDRIEISGYGNSRFLATIWVHINGKWMPTTYFDNWALEVAVMGWYRNASLYQISK